MFLLLLCFLSPLSIFARIIAARKESFSSGSIFPRRASLGPVDFNE